jgi:hypothetical protein
MESSTLTWTLNGNTSTQLTRCAAGSYPCILRSFSVWNDPQEVIHDRTSQADDRGSSAPKLLRVDDPYCLPPASVISDSVPPSPRELESGRRPGRRSQRGVCAWNRSRACCLDSFHSECLSSSVLPQCQAHSPYGPDLRHIQPLRRYRQRAANPRNKHHPQARLDLQATRYLCHRLPTALTRSIAGCVK